DPADRFGNEGQVDRASLNCWSVLSSVPVSLPPCGCPSRVLSDPGCTMRARSDRKDEQMAPRTIEVTREQLLARRERVLARLGVGLDEFRERTASGALSGEE